MLLELHSLCIMIKLFKIINSLKDNSALFAKKPAFYKETTLRKCHGHCTK